jgi:EmrB/QacA subfamily drug resistance transporter
MGPQAGATGDGHLYEYNRCVAITDSRAGERRWLVLVTCCLSLLIVGIDVTIVNVALPSIQRDFHASVSGLQWTVDAYTLVIASLLMLSGSTGDRVGRRRTFQLGLVVFTIGSLLCSLAPNLGTLIAFRAMQAVGGSMLNPVALSIISNTFTERKERARALGVWGAVFGLSLALGPVVGGVLVTDVSWRAIFWINIPVGVAAIILTQLFVPESRAPRARRFDPPGQVLAIVILASLTYAVIEGPDHGWSSPIIIGAFALSACAALAFARVESRRREPLLDLRFFRSAPFTGAALIAVLAFAAMGGFLFLNSLYLQGDRGYSALHAGLLTLWMAAMILVCAPISGRLVGSVGPRLPLVLSGPAIAIGSLLMLRIGQDTSSAYLAVCYVVLGIGFGLVNAPISNTAVSGMPNEQAGTAASIASTSRQVGSSLGVAVGGSIVATSSGTALAIASHPAWAAFAGCGVGVLILGITSTSAWAARTAQRTRDLLAAEGGDTSSWATQGTTRAEEDSRATASTRAH